MASEIARSALISMRNELHHRMVNLCETLLTHEGNVDRTKAAYEKAIKDREAARELLAEMRDDAAQVEEDFKKLTGQTMPRNNVTKEPSP